MQSFFLALCIFEISSVFSQDFSSCAIPNYRVMSVALPGFLDVTRNYTGTFYTGFLVDLLYSMGQVGKFTYTLRLSKNSDFGHQTPGGCFDGAVGALVSNNADFIAHAMDGVIEYQDVLDLTTPIFRSDIQVVYNTRTGLSGASYAVLRNTATRDFLEKSKNPNNQALWSNIFANVPQSLPETYDEAINLVKGGGWAFVGRTPAIDNAVYYSYGLLAKDPKIIKKTYAGFAVQYGSLLRQKLNKVIFKLQDDGTIPTLFAKWFPYSTNC